MTPLEAAKALAETKIFNSSVRPSPCFACPFCAMPDGTSSGFGEMHHPSCPWLAMPQIVAALEAAQAIVWEEDRRGWLPWREMTLCLHMGEPCPDPPDPRALRAAIMGDVA